MKTAIEIFKDCAAVVDDQFQEADAGSRLQATLSLVDLTMRGVAEAFNQQRWKEQTAMAPSPPPAK